MLRHVHFGSKGGFRSFAASASGLCREVESRHPDHSKSRRCSALPQVGLEPFMLFCSEAGQAQSWRRAAPSGLSIAYFHVPSGCFLATSTLTPVTLLPPDVVSVHPFWTSARSPVSKATWRLNSILAPGKNAVALRPDPSSSGRLRDRRRRSGREKLVQRADPGEHGVRRLATWGMSAYSSSCPLGLGVLQGYRRSME